MWRKFVRKRHGMVTGEAAVRTEGLPRGSAVCSALVRAWLGSVDVARAEESVEEGAPTEAPAVAPTPEAIPFDPNIVPALAVRRWQT